MDNFAHAMMDTDADPVTIPREPPQEVIQMLDLRFVKLLDTKANQRGRMLQDAFQVVSCTGKEFAIQESFHRDGELRCSGAYLAEGYLQGAVT